MSISNDRLPGGVKNRTIWMSVALFLIALTVSACGGGGANTAATTEPPVAAQCNPADPGTAAECGTLMIGLTDADGDFLSYTVDVLSLILQKADALSSKSCRTGHASISRNTST